MKSGTPKLTGRISRVRANLKKGMELAWAASPKSLIKFSLLGMINATMTPISVYLGAMLVNRIAEARNHTIPFSGLIWVVIGLWIVVTLQRTISAYMGYGRNLFVRRVELEAEKRLLAKASKVDIGNFDNSNWHDRLSTRKKRCIVEAGRSYMVGARIVK